MGFSEIEKFPCQVLAHRYPTVRNYGDMTKYKEWGIDEPVDILVGGTPCQSFSVAGLRKGLADPRGNLMLTYLAIADRLRPKWVVWENVPGVLSSNGGRDFGTFLGALVELGYGFAYRVLDAQWFGVAQRRRRVFVVGCLGDAGSAAKVLFESESVCRNPAPSREKGGARESIANAPITGAVSSKWAKGTGGPSGDECYNLVNQVNAKIKEGHLVRRLTPMECERLQGFPDGWTDIKTGGKPTPDGPRYKAIGNSMAVPVMRWIGERIHASEAALDSL